MASALVVIEIRFFWAAGNIRRFVTRKLSGPNDRKLVTVVHFPVLLLHSFLLYLLCRLLSTITKWDEVITQGEKLIWFLVVFLTLNCLWLLSLVYKRENWEPEVLWMKNNGMTVVVLIALMLAASRLPSGSIFFVLAAFIALNCNSLTDLFLRADSYLALTEPPPFAEAISNPVENNPAS